jgi:hypothetical protein
VTLFDPEDIPELPCAYPNLAGGTGYNYGCRCPRCRHARFLLNQPRPGMCASPDCDQQRVKHRKWCLSHIPSPKPSNIRGTGVCLVGNHRHEWYESQMTRVSESIAAVWRNICAPCRHRYVGVIQAHNLSTDWAVRLITATECELCHNRFPMGKHRLSCHVDHDHGCCTGKRTCGRCVRGIVCGRCNLILGAVEAADRDIGLDKVRDYLDTARFR